MMKKRPTKPPAGSVLLPIHVRELIGRVRQAVFASAKAATNLEDIAKACERADAALESEIRRLIDAPVRMLQQLRDAPALANRAALDPTTVAAIEAADRLLAHYQPPLEGSRTLQHLIDEDGDRWHVEWNDPCVVRDTNRLAVAFCPDARDAALAARAPEQRAALRVAASAIDGLLMSPVQVPLSNGHVEAVEAAQKAQTVIEEALRIPTDTEGE